MKKLKYILTSLLTVVLCFSVLTITTKASFDYNVKTLSYTHGSVSISSCINADLTDFGGGSSTADICNYLSFTFDKYYSGTVTLKWTYSSSSWRQNLTDWNILVIGGKIDSNNNTSGNIVFRVYDRNEFMVIMTYSSSALLSGTDPTFSFSSASSSLTAVANHNSQYDNIADIETELVSANTQLGGIVSLLGALQTLQTNISNNLNNYVTLQTDGITNTDIETKLNLITSYEQLINGYLTNIDTNLSSVISNQSSANSLLGDIEDNTDGIETLLTAIEGTLIINGVSSIGQIASTQAAILAALSSNGSETLYDLVTDIVDMFTDPNGGLIAELTTLNALVNTTNQKLDEIKTTLGNINTSINNIDNQIDTISWQNLYTGDIGWSTAYNGTFSYNNNTRPLQNNKTVYFNTDITISADVSNSIIKVKLPYAITTSSGSLSTFKFDLVNNSDGKSCNAKYYVDLSNYSTLVYFYDFNTVPYSSSYKLYIKIDSTVLYSAFYKYSANGYVDIITNNDIEYWKLLEYFNQYNYQKQMLDLININVDSETSLTIYNNDNQILDNINNGFGNEYSVFRPVINQQLAPLNDSTLLNEFSNQKTLFDYLFRNLFNIDPNVEDPSTVTNPIFLILIFGGILLALVG